MNETIGIMAQNVKKKRRDPEGFSVITANSLLDGSIYWLSHDLVWSRQFSDAYPFPNAKLDNILENETSKDSNKHLVGIVEEPVTYQDHRCRPTTMKGRIRAFGPHSQI